MAELFDDTEKKKKDLYRLMLAEEATAESTRKYSFPKFKERLSGDKGLLDKVADIAVKKAWAANKDDFYGIYFPETIAPPTPKPQQAAPVASNLQQVSPVEPSAEIEEGEVYIPTPQPAVGSPEYDAQLQMQYGGMSPTLGATFGGVPASFETEKQKKQERISPVFKAQQLAFEDVPIAEEQRRAQREFAKATKEQQKAALRGGTGFEYEQEKKAKEREFGGFSKDFAKSQLAMAKQVGENILTATKNQILEFSNIGVSPMGEEEPEAQYYQREAATRSQEMYNAAAETEQKFRDELSKRNIKTSVYDAIQKGQWNRVPEAVAYTIGEAAIQMGAFYLTRGGSAYLQTLPQEYKDEVDAIAAETNRTPEQVIADGDDAPLIAKFSSGLQYAFEKLGMDQISKGIASRGGYKAVRDWMLKKSKSRALSRAAGLGFVAGTEALTEGTQTGVSQASTLSTSQKPFIAKVNKFFKDPELIRERKEAMTAGAIGGLALAGGGQAIQSAMDRTLFEAPVIGKTSKRPDASVVMTDDKLIQRNNLNKAMESAIQANPEAEGQIRERYRKLNDALELTDDEVVSAYDGIAQLPDSNEKDAIRQRLEQYMAEKGIQPEATGMGAGLGELARQDRGVTPPAPQPAAEEVVVEPITQEEEDEDLLALQEQLRGLVPQEGAETETAQVAPAEEEDMVAAEEVAPIAPLNIDFTKNEGRNVNYQGIEGRIKIDSDGAPYVFTKDGDVVYIEGGLSGQTPQQLGVQPLADDVINEADVEVVLQDENAPLDQNQLQYDFDNNTVTLYGRPFTYEGVETNSKGQTTALRLRDANGKVKFVRNEDTILEFEIQKELYEKSRTNKPLTVESATAAAEQLQVVPAARPEQVSEPVQQERPVGNIEGNEVVSVAPVAPPAPKAKKAAPAPKQEKKEAAPAAAPETKQEGKAAKKQIDKKSVQSSLDKAKEEYEKAKGAFDKKRSELDKTTREDVKDLFGERKVEMKAKGLFEMPRISPQQREKAIQPFRDRMNKAKEEVNRLTKMLEEGEEAAQKITFNKAVEEIKSKPLSHVFGIEMGSNQAEGTYISTERENRYAKSNPNAKISRAEVSIENPLVVTDDVGLVDLRNKILNRNLVEFTEEDFEMYEIPDEPTVDDLNESGVDKLSKLVTKDLKAKGYDSIYFPESKTQEGELIVFDRNNVKFTEYEQVQGVSKETRKGKGTQKTERVVRPKAKPIRNAGKSPDAIAARNITLYSNPVATTLQYLMDATYHPELLEGIFGGPSKTTKSGRKDISAERKARIQFLDKNSTIKKADRLAEFIAEKYAEDNNINLEDAQRQNDFAGIAIEAITDYTSRSQMVRELLRLNNQQNEAFEFMYNPEDIYGEGYNEDIAKEIDGILDELPDSYWEGKEITDEEFGDLFAEAKPTTETKGETKPTEFGKAMSASSRFNPKELVVFDTPIVGPNGNKLVAYQWAYEWTMKENKEGELVDKRISDWTQAESSAETGRDVVHKFTVEKTDGTTVTVSSETIPSLLGYTEAKQMKGLPSVVSAVKTLAKQRMRLAILEAQEAEFNALEEKFEKSEKPEVKEIEDPYAKQFGLNKKGEFTTYGMGDVWRRQDNKYNRDTDSFKKVPLSRETIKELEREWVKKRIEEAGGKYPSNISDLRNRVKRQEKKVEEATNSKITIKEQTAPSTPTTAPTPSLASQVESKKPVLEEETIAPETLKNIDTKGYETQMVGPYVIISGNIFDTRKIQGQKWEYSNGLLSSVQERNRTIIKPELTSPTQKKAIEIASAHSNVEKIESGSFKPIINYIAPASGLSATELIDVFGKGRPIPDNLYSLPFSDFEKGVRDILGKVDGLNNKISSAKIMEDYHLHNFGKAPSLLKSESNLESIESIADFYGKQKTESSTKELASQVEEMRTLPPAKRKAMQESLEAQYGKEEVAKMIEITANFTKIIDDLEEKGIVKKDCP